MSLQLKILSPLILLFLMLTQLQASKLERGFEALKIYDYFQAKKLFGEICIKKNNAYAAYGLALIFSRTDNPFSNNDSANRYIQLSYAAFHSDPISVNYSGFLIDKQNILKLADTIAYTMYQNVKRLNTITSYNFFLKNFYLAPSKLIREALYARDELEFNMLLQINKSDTTRFFLTTHPQSSFCLEATLLLDREVYDENTKENDPVSYSVFLDTYPKNVMRNTAYEKLFAIYRLRKDTAGLASFVQNYPLAPQNLEAWKLLFSLSVSEFSFDELKKFVGKFPDFPLKNSILKELELNKLVLYPYQLADFTGFIDDKTKFIIKPVYDAATDFYEGLAVVSKNDSVFFINKQNINPFNKIYTEAFVFKNGIAPVKQNNKWFFINRQGQSISKFYDEINELSDGVYIVKAEEKYGALDQYGHSILEPSYDKLGDFKNGYAYYIEKGVYGFVSRSGAAHKAEFEWISDFNSKQIAIIQQSNKYGLINAIGQKILQPNYDQIIKTNGTVFILITGNLYGFFSSEGCFLTPVMYDFAKEKQAEYYTNGNLFKLIKKTEQALVDENGRMNINFGAYQEVNFAGNDLIRVKQKNKYGYVDRKLNLVIPYKYQQAADFSDSLALVKYKDNTIMIHTTGREVFSTGADITKISTHYYTVNDDVRSIINHLGELLFTEVDNVQKVHFNLFIVTLNNGEIKLLSD